MLHSSLFGAYEKSCKKTLKIAGEVRVHAKKAFLEGVIARNEQKCNRTLRSDSRHWLCYRIVSSQDNPAYRSLKTPHSLCVVDLIFCEGDLGGGVGEGELPAAVGVGEGEGGWGVIGDAEGGKLVGGSGG